SELNILDGATLSTTELNYVDGVTSAIQTQLDSKIEDLSSFDTDDLTEGSSNLYSQWSRSGGLIQPATDTDLIATANGTASDPSLTFINDDDTGLYRSDANVLGFATNGTAQVTI